MMSKISLFCIVLLSLLNASTVARGEERVINVRVSAYGAKGDGINDDTIAINKAIAALATPGNPSVLYFPPGIYMINSAQISAIPVSDVWVRGDGYNSVLKRIASSGASGILKTGAISGVKISDLSFDLNLTGANLDNTIGLNANNASKVRIEDCRFWSSAAYSNNGAHIDGIRATACPSLWVVRNRFEGCQVTMSESFGGGPGVFVKDNYFTDARAHAILFKVINNSKSAAACTIAGNIIHNVGKDSTSANSAICIGRESSSDPGAVANDIQVIENQITGSWGSATKGIAGIAASASHGWVIAGNILRNEAASVGSGTCGIDINGGSGLKDLAVSGNVIKGMGSAGLSLTGNLSGARVIGNHVENTGGVHIEGTAGREGRVTVMGNVSVANAGRGLYLRANNGDLTARVMGNELRNSTGSGSCGLQLETGSHQLTVEVFQNEINDDRGTGKTQTYGIKYAGTGAFNVRFYDNNLDGYQNGGACFPANPPGVFERRDNVGWP